MLLGSFWRPKNDALARATQGSAGWVPSGCAREAYSWGGLARTTVAAGGTGVWGASSQPSGGSGWTLLLPFGLTNVAYWTPSADPPVRRVSPAAARSAVGAFGGEEGADGAAAWENRRGQGAGHDQSCSDSS